MTNDDKFLTDEEVLRNLADNVVSPRPLRSESTATATATLEQDGRRVTVTCTGPAGSHERLAEAATAALRAAVVQLYPPF